MPFAMYDGSLQDTEVTPQVLARDKNTGKLTKTVIKPAETSYMPLEKVKLYGIEFPKGEWVKHPSILNGRLLASKMKAMGCFHMRDEVPEEAEEQESLEDLGAAPEVDPDDLELLKRPALMAMARQKGIALPRGYISRRGLLELLRGA